MMSPELAPICLDRQTEQKKATTDDAHIHFKRHKRRVADDDTHHDQNSLERVKFKRPKRRGKSSTFHHHSGLSGFKRRSQ